MEKEYDFSNGVRGKYHKALKSIGPRMQFIVTGYDGTDENAMERRLT